MLHVETSLKLEQLVAFLYPVLYIATFVFPFKIVLCAFRSLVLCPYRSVDTLIGQSSYCHWHAPRKGSLVGFCFFRQDENLVASHLDVAGGRHLRW